MRPPRGLSTGEQAAWAHLASSVTPMAGRKRPVPPAKVVVEQPSKAALGAGSPVSASATKSAKAVPKASAGKMHKMVTVKGSPPLVHEQPAGLDSHWDRRMKSGRLDPDLTLDLHGHTLDTAYDRIMAGLDQARAMGARVVLVIAGRERPVDPADRAHRRGAIRAKLLDWLAASRHGSAVAAVRRAHIRHGGEGAIYLILKRQG